MKWYLLLLSFIMMACESHPQLKTLHFSPFNGTLLNPERGTFLIRQTGMTIGRVTPYEPLQLADLQQIRREHTLLFRYFGLKQWRTAPLPETALRSINDDFDLLRAAGLKAIVRFAYGAQIGEPDAPRSVILQHLQQLKPILFKYKDVIAVVQAGFIGPWGEWHSSTEGHETPEARRAILNAILDAVPSDRFVQLRTPRYKQEFLGLPYDPTAAITPDAAFSAAPVARLGHHNDCFLSDESDMGTYWRDNRLDTALGKPYVARDTRYVPMGGETCRMSEFVNCPNAVREMARAHWSFLNAGYHPDVLQTLTSQGCIEEVRKRLGYRIRLIDAAFPAVAPHEAGVQFRFRFVNEGWAAPFNKRPVELVLRHTQGRERYVVRLPADPRYWLPEETVTVEATVGVPATMPAGAYEVILHFPDPEPLLRERGEYALRLASAVGWEETSGYHLLGDAVIVTKASGVKHSGSLWLRPADGARGDAAPGEFHLGQNFPNPFNGFTLIPFSARRDGIVAIEIFDLPGRRVRTLFRDVLRSTDVEYSIGFDASTLASGVYIARMLAYDLNGTPRYTASRRVLLVK